MHLNASLCYCINWFVFYYNLLLLKKSPQWIKSNRWSIGTKIIYIMFSLHTLKSFLMRKKFFIRSVIFSLFQCLKDYFLIILFFSVDSAIVMILFWGENGR